MCVMAGGKRWQQGQNKVSMNEQSVSTQKEKKKRGGNVLKDVCVFKTYNCLYNKLCFFIGTCIIT